jgi:hypothetical protein
MKIFLRIWLMIALLVFPSMALAQALEQGKIVEFTSLDKVINYDNDAQGPSVSITIQWALENPPSGYSLRFTQIEIDGRVDQVQLISAEAIRDNHLPELADNQAYLIVLVGSAGATYNEQIYLHMALLDIGGNEIDSADLSIPVKFYSIAAGHNSPKRIAPQCPISHRSVCSLKHPVTVEN